jgi:tRNA-modifying protein YgfZ
MAEQQGVISFLSDHGVIRASGEEARHFLHNQLTNDVENLGADDARLAGYCSPKGRLLASLLIWPSDDALLMLLPKSLLPGFQKRLQMFVLRSKVTLQDVSDTLAVVGIGMPVDQDFPALAEAPYLSQPVAGGRLIRLTDSQGLRRALWIGPAGQRDALLAGLPSGLQPQPEAHWRWLDIQAGVPQILEATREQFVPQMVNFELVGGVNFRKGCYPGQEIVARSQYLGKLKRRMLLASIDINDPAAVAPGTEVFSEADPDQPAGMIVNAERGPDGRIDCLVEIKTEATLMPVHLGAASGPLLQFKALPYPLEAAA